MGDKPSTPQAYLDDLPAERRQELAAVRDVVLRHLPDGYEETMNWGMISYELPLARYPATYNKQPLMLAALAAQKNHLALYLNCVYQAPDRAEALKERFAAAGKRLDMGKSCLRFKTADSLALDAIGDVIAGTPPERFIAEYEASRAASGR
jgi:hypothetical protein